MQGEAPVQLGEIGQIAITAYNVERAADFYRDTLGMQELFRMEKMAFLQCGSVRLMLTEPESEEYRHPASILYYRVPDVEQAHAALYGAGIPFERGPHIIHRDEKVELWMAFLKDPEGNTLALMGEKSLS